MKPSDKLETFLNSEILDELKSILVTRHGSNYRLFGLYEVYQNASEYYQVSSKKNNISHEFISVRNAIAWCTFDHVNHFIESKKVKQLDDKLSSVMVDIQIHKKILNLADSDNDTKTTQKIKLHEATRRQKLILKELNDYINKSKEIQLRKFTSKKQQVVSKRKR